LTVKNAKISSFIALETKYKPFECCDLYKVDNYLSCLFPEMFGFIHSKVKAKPNSNQTLNDHRTTGGRQVENSNFSSFSIYDIYYRSASETNILSKQTAGGQKLRPKILKGINSKMLFITQPLSTERWYSKVMVFNIRPTTLHWISSAISLTKTMF